MAEINCDICLTDETLTFVNIVNIATTSKSKKFKIEAIGHDRIYACLDSDPSATFVNNVYSTCLASGCFGATNYVILKNFQSFYKENNMSYYINLSINGVGYEIDPCSNIIDQINLNYIDIVEAKYQLDDSNQPNNISLRNLTDEVLKIIVERGEETFCLAPGSGISCDGAICSIELEQLYPVIGDTENTVIVTVKKGSEIRTHEFQYIDGGDVFGDFWNINFDDWVQLTTSDYVTFSNKVAEHVDVSMQSARLLNPPYPFQPEIADVNPTFKIIDGVMSFCLSKRLDE